MSNKNYEAYKDDDFKTKKWEGYRPTLTDEISSDLEDLLDELNENHTIVQDLINELSDNDSISDYSSNNLKIMLRRTILSIQYATEILDKNKTIKNDISEC